MRLLTVIDHLGAGGRQRTAQNYTLGYQAAGHDAAVLTLAASGPRLAPLQRAGVPVFLSGDAPAARERAVEEAAAWAPDVIHLHSVGPVGESEACVVEALKARLGDAVPVMETTSFGKVDYNERYTLTDVLLLKSRWALWRWAQWSEPLERRPVGAVIPNTVDDGAFYPETPGAVAALRAQHGLPADAVVFGCVARPDPLKWPPILFNAFARVAASEPRAHLLAVGLAEEARPYLEALAPDVRARVVEIPFLRGDDALRLCYSALDVFLHACPIGESFGLVFVESLLCGTPVVTLNTPAKNNSQLEVVGHLRGGMIVNDEAGMASAMRQLLRDAPLRRRLAERGAAHVRATYTLGVVIPQLLRVADAARIAPSREALARTLRADAGLITEVSDREINALLSDTLGIVPRRQRVLKRLVHTPLFARAWWATKSAAGRLRAGAEALRRVRE